MSGARLQKRARLLKAAEFKRVFDRPVKSGDRYFTLLARKREPGIVTSARLGLAISRRNARLAVTRNRIKRVVRESFRHQEFDQAIDCVVMVTAAGARADNRTLSRSLDQHWQNIKSRCAKS